MAHLVSIKGQGKVHRERRVRCLLHFHLARCVVFIIQPGWGTPAVAFLLNKIKYLETEWETPRADLSLSKYSLQKLKYTTLMQRKKKAQKKAPVNTFNPLVRAPAGW